MPSLQVRDLPEHIYQAIVERAKAERRSISQETIVLLEKALALSEGIPTRRKLVLDEINQEPPLAVMDLPDPVTLIRVDRER